MTVTAITIHVLILEIIKQKSSSSRRNLSASTRGKSAKVPPELMRLLQGDREVAESLIESVRYCNPNRSYKWCCEKVIHDLLRDRRA